MKLELATLLAKDIPPFVIKWAKEWLMELGSDAQEQEDIADFVDNSTDTMIIRKADQLWDGGWVDMERTARGDELAELDAAIAAEQADATAQQIKENENKV